MKAVGWVVKAASRLLCGALFAVAVSCASTPREAAPPASHAGPPNVFAARAECHLEHEPGTDDASIAELERRCVPDHPKYSGDEINDCPCVALGYVLSKRPEAELRVRGMRISIAECRSGSVDACDNYYLWKSLCLRQPELPECGPLRSMGVIPEETLPIESVLGCRQHGDLVVCLERDRFYIRGADGVWDQGRASHWERDDEPTRARWKVGLTKHGKLLVTKLFVESTSSGIPSGTYRRLNSRRLLEAKRAIAQLPKVEERCRAVYKCLEAIARQSAPPPPPVQGSSDEGYGEGEGEEEELEVPFTEMLTSLRGCERAQTLGLASLDSQPVPKQCVRQ